MELTEQKMRTVLACCAEQLLRQRFGANEECRYRWLVEELENMDSETAQAIVSTTQEDRQLVYGYKEDVLGNLYLSLRQKKERKKSGSYYTPKEIAKRVVGGLFSKNIKKHCDTDERREQCGKELKILDPACGTGSILLELPESCRLQQLYGYDIDPVAIAITRINMALTYGICDKTLLTEHFAVKDFLQEESPETMDLILGNPPWGAAFTQEEKAIYRGKFCTAGCKSIESGDLFVEQSLNVLRPGGKLCFVLPEALLHVKTHRTVRALILEQSDVSQVEYLGEVFKKVQCPSVIMVLEKKMMGETADAKTVNLCDRECESIVRLSEDRFLVDATEEEFALLQKLSRMQNAVTLKGHAVFALGIVTGNNAKHLKKGKEEGWEPILRGTDIERFRIKEAASYILFSPEQYQQIAPMELYRVEEKLLYRFVGERPVFAYDNRQRLTLNSCNIVIPAMEGMDMRYIMAVFNSRVIEFWHRRCNHSMKLLRAHIEGFPIPPATQEQQREIVRLVERLQDDEQVSERERDRVYGQLDEKITELFSLTVAEYELVRRACMN